MSAMQSEAMRPPQAANYVGLSASTLAKRRLTGDGPRFIRLSARAIGYLKSDLDEWLTARRFGSTSEYDRTVAHAAVK
jgi:predicted DNA-binding transcriptional regulator AlpA